MGGCLVIATAKGSREPVSFCSLVSFGLYSIQGVKEVDVAVTVEMQMGLVCWPCDLMVLELVSRRDRLIDGNPS